MAVILAVWHTRVKRRGRGISDGWQCSQCVDGGRSKTIAGLLEERGGCGGRFSPKLDGAERRVAWCSWNADLIDLPPVVSLERVFGEGFPDMAIDHFKGEPDEYGHTGWLEVTSCPLFQVDDSSPGFSSGWLVDVYSAAAGIAAKLPPSWHIPDPSPLLVQAVIALKSESDSAQYFRTENSEDW